MSDLRAIAEKVVYMAGLFGWTCLMAESLFGFGRSIHSPLIRSKRDGELRPGCSPAGVPNHRSQAN